MEDSALDRRQLMAGLAAGGAAALARHADAAAARARQPHILYILADDLGFADLGFRGSDIATPSIDSLAANGLVLEQFYTQPLCTPTRAALMSGRYPFRQGLQTGVIPSGGTYGLPLDERTLPQVLAGAGYRTAIVGKWHLGHADRAFWPGNRGFQSSYGPLIGEIDHFTHRSHGVLDWYRDGQPLEEAGYDTDLFGAEAVRIVNGHDAGTPLFLYLAFTAPHTPFQAPAAWEARYGHIADPNRRTYAAMVSAMDAQVGAVLAALEARGMRRDTLVIFHSDNGGTRSKMFVGEAEQPGELPASNAPLRDGKGSLYEGGIRTGAVINWPGQVAPGRAQGLFHVVDMLPTLAGIAGAGTAGTRPLDGADMSAALLGRAASSRREIVANVEPVQAAVREGRWKLVWTPVLPPKVELFDLDRDQGESTNLADQHPDIVRRLEARLIDLSKEAEPPSFMEAALDAVLSQQPNFPPPAPR